MYLILTNLESTDMLAVLKKKQHLVKQVAGPPFYHRLLHDSSSSVTPSDVTYPEVHRSILWHQFKKLKLPMWKV